MLSSDNTLDFHVVIWSLLILTPLKYLSIG